MWISPEEVLLANALWVTRRTMHPFALQERKGHGQPTGFFSRVLGTLDALRDGSQQQVWRILLQPAGSDVSYIIAKAFEEEEIYKHWEYLQEELVPKLEPLEPEDIKAFVFGKVRSLVMDRGVDPNSMAKFDHAVATFRRIFSMPKEERLVTYYSCCYWRQSTPFLGWMYLSMNHLCFYSNILGNQEKLTIPWTTVIKVEQAMTMTDGIIITVSHGLEDFRFFNLRHQTDVIHLVEQLTNKAMRRLLEISDDVFSALDDMEYETRLMREEKREALVSENGLFEYYQKEGSSEVTNMHSSTVINTIAAESSDEIYDNSDSCVNIMHTMYLLSMAWKATRKNNASNNCNTIKHMRSCACGNTSCTVNTNFPELACPSVMLSLDVSRAFSASC
eukprot:m.72987 g.72987  ORF g.72987 m.72987 type:complete len:390 (+) comp12353_c0_seq1:293-1462(+)